METPNPFLDYRQDAAPQKEGPPRANVGARAIVGLVVAGLQSLVVFVVVRIMTENLVAVSPAGLLPAWSGRAILGAMLGGGILGALLAREFRPRLASRVVALGIIATVAYLGCLVAATFVVKGTAVFIGAFLGSWLASSASTYVFENL